MRDPIDELENFSTPGLPMNPLPASEVRRRGTRMRRRNNALATIGAAAAVAVIATPIALAAGGGNSGGSAPNPGPATQPSGGWVQTIPTDFPLTAGLPESNEHDGSPVTARDGFEQQVPEICEGAGWTSGGASDVRQATYTGLNEDSKDRALALYPDEGAAQSAFDQVATNVQACSTQTDGKKQRRTEILPSQLGEDSLLFVNHYTDAGDVQVVQLVRIGNAILEDATPGLGAGDPAVLGQLTVGLQEKSAEVVDQMCVFSAEGCDPARPDASDAVDEPTGLSGSIPDDFPLEQGLPTGGAGPGLEGPSHDLDLAVYNLENNLQACGVAPERLPEPADTLSAGHRSAATGILRQLMTFESAADAETYAENLMAPFAACPEDADSRGVTKVYEVVGEEAGDQASSAVMRVEVEGEPGPGFQIVQVVRVGKAVLQTLVVSEEEPSKTLDELRTTYLENSQPVIDAMGA